MAFQRNFQHIVWRIKHCNNVWTLYRNNSIIIYNQLSNININHAHFIINKQTIKTPFGSQVTHVCPTIKAITISPWYMFLNITILCSIWKSNRETTITNEQQSDLEHTFCNNHSTLLGTIGNSYMYSIPIWPTIIYTIYLGIISILWTNICLFL